MFPSRSEAEPLAGPVRPPILSHHSTSVPSTPRQHARERRERTPRSRTPSPRKGMGHHSPKSVYSESSGMEAQKRGCELEPAQPLGRRRFDWTIGNDKVLPFNKPELAPVLHAGVEKQLAGDAQQLYDQLAPTDDSMERRWKLVTKLEGLLKKTWPETSFKVYLYGSSGNMLCTSDSDVDICIETPNKTFEKVCYLARMFAGNGMQRVICMNFIRAVPIVKIWDPELNLACDMNVNNKLALWNTRMIKAYVRLDARVKQLALIIKYWTRRRRIHEAGPPGTLSSYTWTCMIINFLQTRKPPILPALTDDESEQAMSCDHWESAILRLEAFEGFNTSNTEPLTALLFGFFFHHGYGVDYENEVISVRLGRLIPKVNKPGFTEPLCVEEPFTPHKNLSASADVFSIHGIHTELRRAFELIRDGKLEECCGLYQHPELSSEPRRRVGESVSEKPRATPRPLLRRSSSQQSGRAIRTANSVRVGRGEQSPRSGLSGLRPFSVANRQQHYQTLPRSPPHGALTPDQFESSSIALHDQLYHHYNFLRNQQAVLQAQLVQSQSAQPDHSRQQYSYPFGILYQHPVHYASLSAAAQPLYQQGATTNPPSPSLSTVDPLLRRGFKRTSDNNGGLGGSIRSQSQPARFLPTNTAQQNVVPTTFDVSATEGPPIIGPLQPPTANGQYYGSLPMAPSVSQGVPLRSPLGEHGLQKPYVGYYLANRSQVVPSAHQALSQYRNLQLAQIPTYSDLAHHRRKVSPDTAHPNNLSGLDEVSRPQSPLSHVRSYSMGVPLTPLPQSQPFDTTRQRQASGPVIVNGSSPAIPLQLTQRNLSQLDKHGSKLREHHNPAIHPSMFDSLWDDRSRKASSAEQTLNVNDILQWQDQPEPPFSDAVKRVNGDLPVAIPLKRTSTGSPSEQINSTVEGMLDTSDSKTHRSSCSDAPTSQCDAERPMQLGLISESSGEAGREHQNQGPTRHSTLPLPMLSPVAEMLTPLPGMRSFDLPRVHLTNGSPGSMHPPPPTPTSLDVKENQTRDHVRSKFSITNKTEVNGTANGTANGTSQSNAWQQAGKKNKRTKANADHRSATGIKGQGEPMPVLESERKGG